MLQYGPDEFPGHESPGRYTSPKGSLAYQPETPYYIGKPVEWLLISLEWFSFFLFSWFKNCNHPLQTERETDKFMWLFLSYFCSKKIKKRLGGEHCLPHQSSSCSSVSSIMYVW